MTRAIRLVFGPASLHSAPGSSLFTRVKDVNSACPPGYQKIEASLTGGVYFVAWCHVDQAEHHCHDAYLLIVRINWR